MHLSGKKNANGTLTLPSGGGFTRPRLQKSPQANSPQGHCLPPLIGCTLPKTSVLDHAVAVFGDVSDLVEKGRITHAGVELLEQSLSTFAPGQLRAGMQPADVFAATTVRNWAVQCYRMFDYLPATCPECNADQARLNERRQVVCGGCSARLTPMEGDEISRNLVEQFAASRLPETV